MVYLVANVNIAVGDYAGCRIVDGVWDSVAHDDLGRQKRDDRQLESCADISCVRCQIGLCVEPQSSLSVVVGDE